MSAPISIAAFAAWLCLALPAHAEPDLRLRELPAPTASSLRMRLSLEPAPAPAPGSSSASLSYRAFPRDVRDLEERVIARLSAGYALDSAPLSGDASRTGFDPSLTTDPDGNPIRTSRQYLLGDAVLGTRGVLLPSLNTYFLSRFRLDADGATRHATLTDVYDRRGGSDLIVRAGYAEIDGLGDGALRRVHMRGGRLFRGGAASYVTNFDGAAAGWRDRDLALDAYVGRRVSLYPVDDPGLVGGASATLRADLGAPVDLGLDYAFFGGVDDAGGAAVARHVLALTARARLGDTRVSLRGRLVERGVGLGLGRVGARLRQPLGARAVVVADLEERFAGELAYDLAAADSTDVVDAARLPALGLEPPAASTRIGVRGELMLTRALELYGFGRASLVHGASTSHFTHGWGEGGVAVAATRGRLTTSAQFKLRAYQLDDDANQAGDGFTDTSGSGVAGFRELGGEARYRLGGRTGSAAVGAYYRVYDLRSPYAEVDGDGRGGARVDADYWPLRAVRLALSGELAQPSPTFARELSTLASARLIAEARF